MCRRFWFAALFLLLVLPLVFISAAAADTGDYVISNDVDISSFSLDEICHRFGFADEESFYDFLVFLMDFSSYDGDMESYLADSIYYSMHYDPDVIYDFYSNISTGDYGISPAIAGNNVDIGMSGSTLSFNYLAYDGTTARTATYRFLNMPVIANTSTYAVYAVDFSNYVTTTSLQVEMQSVVNAIDRLYNGFFAIPSQMDNSFMGTFVRFLYEISSSSSNIYNALHSTGFPVLELLSGNRSNIWSQSFTGDIDSLLNVMNNSMVQGFNFLNSQFQVGGSMLSTAGSYVNQWYGDSFHGYTSVSATIPNLLVTYGNSMVEGIASLYRSSIGSDAQSVLSYYDFDPETLIRSEKEVTYNNLLDAIVGIGQLIQRPVSQLQAVLASDGDLKLRQDTQEEVDAIIDDFTGDGGSAPSTGDISDTAGVTTGMKDAFDSGVSAGDFFTALNDDDAYSFFSQESADSIDSTDLAQPLAEDDAILDLSDLEELDDDFYVVLQPSVFDYLFGGEEP